MAAEGFELDVTYVEASGDSHVFLLDIDCRRSTWSLFDARLNFITTGKHGPPGIDNKGIGAITGTAFWYKDSSTVCLVLSDFLTIPYYKSKYPKGHTGTGHFVEPPEVYLLSSKKLDFVVG